MRSALICGLLVLWLAPSAAGQQGAAGPQGAAAKPPAPVRPATWYAATVANDERGGFLLVHFWSKGSLFRSEAVLAGRRIVTIVDSETYYVIDEVGWTGIAIARSEAARARDAKRKRPFANELDQLLAEGGELVGTEQAEGQTVDVYRVTNSQGRRTIWVSTTNPPVPLRIETFDRESSTTGKIDYVNWLQNPAIADAFFVPNPRIQIDHYSYDAYRKRIRQGPVGPAPVLYRHLLHGEK